MTIQTSNIRVWAILLYFFLLNDPSAAFGGFLSNGRHIMKGRDALLVGNPKAALPNFEAIAQSSPNFINCAEEFCVGIWTYVGRTQHELGENQKALESLKKGKGRHHSDRMNQVYLGLVMAMSGQRQQGKAELEAGLKVLGDWLSNFAGRGTTGSFWDPGGSLQKSIADIQKSLQVGEINWDRVNDSIQSLSVSFEQEARDVRSQKNDDRMGF